MLPPDYLSRHQLQIAKLDELIASNANLSANSSSEKEEQKVLVDKVSAKKSVATKDEEFEQIGKFLLAAAVTFGKITVNLGLAFFVAAGDLGMEPLTRINKEWLEICEDFWTYSIGSLAVATSYLKFLDDFLLNDLANIEKAPYEKKKEIVKGMVSKAQDQVDAEQAISQMWDDVYRKIQVMMQDIDSVFGKYEYDKLEDQAKTLRDDIKKLTDNLDQLQSKIDVVYGKLTLSASVPGISSSFSSSSPNWWAQIAVAVASVSHGNTLSDTLKSRDETAALIQTKQQKLADITAKMGSVAYVRSFLLSSMPSETAKLSKASGSFANYGAGARHDAQLLEETINAMASGSDELKILFEVRLKSLTTLYQQFRDGLESFAKLMNTNKSKWDKNIKKSFLQQQAYLPEETNVPEIEDDDAESSTEPSNST